MKIIVLDIETTGLHTTYSSIVEIGMVLVDTEAKTIKTLFDEVVREKNFNPKYKAWIFENSDLTPSDVMKAKTLESYRKKIQGYLNKYPVTAFNKSFDLRFFKDRGFIYNDIKCIMQSTKTYFKLKKNNRVKTPSVEEAYKVLFPTSNYIEKHRGGDDAKHEAKILLKMCEMKTNKNKLKTIIL